MPTAITEVVKSLNQAESLFGLRRSLAPDFFSEWQTHLPDLTSGEEASLDRIKASYLHNSADGPVSESTINLLLVSPLLYLSSLCDPPLRLRGEAPVNITVEDAEQTLSGRIEALVMEGQFWVFLAESKQAKLSFSMAIPQALTYMMGSPNESTPLFGMVTNGDGFLFIKLAKQAEPIYALSDDFSLFRQSRNELYSVLKILKQIRIFIGD